MKRHDSSGPRLGRRSLLRAAGVSISLPAFESLRGSRSASASENVQNEAPRRMVCVGNMLGFYPDAFWPKQAENQTGDADQQADAQPALSTTLQSLQPHRRDLTVIEGLDHDLKGGHFSIHAFLSGVRSGDAKSMPDGNITLDQFAAESIGGQTRFPSLVIGSESGIHGGCQMSWTRAGTRVPPISGPRQLFEKLFVGVADADKRQAADRFRLKESILDAVNGDAKSLAKRLNRRDQRKLDEYLTSIRDVEQRIDLSKQWIDIEKPAAPFEPPKNTNMVEDLPVLYELIALALQTDSTRIATLELGGDFEARDFGFRSGYHALSHHGQRPDAIEALIKIESYQVEQFSKFLTRLRDFESGESNLLDQTAVLFGSGMGNANSHTNTNLPIVLAGGGFRHRGTMSFDRKAPQRPPLTNLYLSMLHRFGIEVDRFSTSTGTLRGLEWA
ncbi:DUF1552 domain-containing protein [Roseiconus nitratireducens]|uniref:DUF1552 domain-containing protein n=1 Tax=Roseiconus nitratireducens TaxID=2605748 RepID=A0A5M6DJ11_9BACT|nr:DUF1552 domain-containing protein [Roseiconus nitratireducens]KAA5545255.1 DUF1552 domain-containing protein [Roseiconus nitratireducens]